MNEPAETTITRLQAAAVAVGARLVGRVDLFHAGHADDPAVAARAAAPSRRKSSRPFAPPRAAARSRRRTRSPSCPTAWRRRNGRTRAGGSSRPGPGRPAQSPARRSAGRRPGRRTTTTARRSSAARCSRRSMPGAPPPLGAAGHWPSLGAAGTAEVTADPLPPRATTAALPAPSLGVCGQDVVQVRAARDGAKAVHGSLDHGRYIDPAQVAL